MDWLHFCILLGDFIQELKLYLVISHHLEIILNITCSLKQHFRSLIISVYEKALKLENNFIWNVFLFTHHFDVWRGTETRKQLYLKRFILFSFIVQHAVQLFQSFLIFFYIMGRLYIFPVRSTVVHSSTVSPMEQTNMVSSRERQGTYEPCKNPRDCERSSGNIARTSQAPQRIPTGNCLFPKLTIINDDGALTLKLYAMFLSSARKSCWSCLALWECECERCLWS